MQNDYIKGSYRSSIFVSGAFVIGLFKVEETNIEKMKIKTDKEIKVMRKNLSLTNHEVFIGATKLINLNSLIRRGMELKRRSLIKKKNEEKLLNMENKQNKQNENENNEENKTKKENLEIELETASDAKKSKSKEQTINIKITGHLKNQKIQKYQ